MALVLASAIARPARAAEPEATEPGPSSVEIGPEEQADTDAEPTEEAPPEHPADEATEPDEPAPIDTGLADPANPENAVIIDPVVPSEDAEGHQAASGREPVDPTQAEAPRRMSPMLIAGSWTMFGAIVLGAVGGGVFFGLAQRQQDEAERLALGFDPETGSRFVYGERAAEYDDILAKGRAFKWASAGFMIAAGAALAASITLFALHARRSKTERQHAATRKVSPFGVEVRF